MHHFHFHRRTIPALLALLLSACTDWGTGVLQMPPDTSGQITVAQGAWGNVWFWRGDFMPTTEQPTGTITPVQREIYVYEATRSDSVERVGIGPFYRVIHSRLVARTSSNSTGFFQVALPVGKYSFFVLEDSLFYAGEMDSTGNYTSAIVHANTVVKCQINIQYQAAF